MFVGHRTAGLAAKRASCALYEPDRKRDHDVVELVGGRAPETARLWPH